MLDKDIKHLNWIHDRLKNIHGEDHNVDYMHALRRCIKNYESTTTDHDKLRAQLKAANERVETLEKKIKAYQKAHEFNTASPAMKMAIRMEEFFAKRKANKL